MLGGGAVAGRTVECIISMQQRGLECYSAYTIETCQGLQFTFTFTNKHKLHLLTSKTCHILMVYRKI